MKRNVLVIAGLAVLSTSAFASKARIEALGQGAIYNVKDSRSVFVNPAALNGMGNTIVTEWGTAGAADAAATPRAEGGFTREMGSFNYGLYMGNDSSRLAHGGTFLGQSNALDLMLAGDMGMKWGARLHYANRTDETISAGTITNKNSALGVGLGVMQGDLGAYLNMDLNDKSSGSTASASHESKLKPSFTLGASYMWSGYNFYAEYTANKLEENTGTAATTKDTTIVVGAGRTHEINPTSRVMYNAMLSLNTNDVAAGKTKTNKLPVTVALETEATSWLTLRGSISQNVVIGDVKNTAGKKKTTANSTDVAAGAALNFGKLTLDGMIGNTGVNRGTGTAGTEEGALTTDNLMTRVGLTYKF